VNEREALAAIAELIELGAWEFTKSARVGMRAHDIVSSEVLEALSKVTTLRRQAKSDTWTTDALDSADRPIRIVVAGLVLSIRIVSAHLIIERGAPRK